MSLLSRIRSRPAIRVILGIIIFLLAVGIVFALEDVRPDATVSASNGSCNTSTAHVNLDEDVDGTADGAVCTATANSSNHDIHLNFATPSANPSTATNAQVFAFRAKRNATGGNGNPTVSADLYCNGSVVEAGTAQVLTDSYDLYTESFTFNSGSCAASGSDAQVFLNCTVNGGGSNQRSCSYESVEWRMATPTAPTVTTDVASSITATSGNFNGNVTATGGDTVTTRGFANGTVSTLSGGDTGTTTESGSFGTGTFSAATSSLASNATYYFRAYATNSAGTSFGIIRSLLTLPGTPGTPSLSNVTATSTTVSWTAPTGGTDTYKLQYCVNGSTPCTLSTGLAVTSTTTNPSLTGNTTYSFAVRGTNATGDGVFSASSTQLTRPNIPGTPTFSNITNAAMRVSWTAPTGGAASYKVERCTGSGCTNFSEIASGETNTFYDDSGLSAVTTYRYRIRATNATGDGLYSTPAEQATTANIPTVSTNAASSITSNAATLNGNISATGGENASVRGFAWGTNSNLANGDTATTTENGSFGTGSFLNNLSSLSPLTTYYFRAYATNGGGTGYGTILSFTTDSDVVLPTPTRTLRLFEGFKLKFQSGKIILHQK